MVGKIATINMPEVRFEGRPKNKRMRTEETFFTRPIKFFMGFTENLTFLLTHSSVWQRINPQQIIMCKNIYLYTFSSKCH